MESGLTRRAGRNIEPGKKSLEFPHGYVTTDLNMRVNVRTTTTYVEVVPGRDLEDF